MIARKIIIAMVFNTIVKPITPKIIASNGDVLLKWELVPRADCRMMQAISTSIASAVEEQSSAAQEIARSVLEASQYAQSVDDVSQINRCAQETGSAVEQLTGAIGNLGAQMDVMRGQVDAFLGNIRAA